LAPPPAAPAILEDPSDCDAVTLSDSRATTQAHHLYGRRNNCGRTVPKFGACVDLCGGVCYAPILSANGGCSQRGSRRDDSYPGPPITSCPYCRCGSCGFIRRPQCRPGSWPTAPPHDVAGLQIRSYTAGGRQRLTEQWAKLWRHHS